ncbi:MAG: hypothetical protein HGB37_02585 [Candidatus Moranbacteria bacterium]|nr:hypothetical protein [Candidatus Moranbacteria bacterium]
MEGGWATVIEGSGSVANRPVSGSASEEAESFAGEGSGDDGIDNAGSGAVSTAGITMGGTEMAPASTLGVLSESFFVAPSFPAEGVSVCSETVVVSSAGASVIVSAREGDEEIKKERARIVGMMGDRLRCIVSVRILFLPSYQKYS